LTKNMAADLKEVNKKGGGGKKKKKIAIAQKKCQYERTKSKPSNRQEDLVRRMQKGREKWGPDHRGKKAQLEGLKLRRVYETDERLIHTYTIFCARED